MEKSDWAGVFPAITTPFQDDGSINETFLAEHASWMIENGCSGIVALGSLGEGATLTCAEKVRELEVLRAALGRKVPLIAGISGLSTTECVALAQAAQRAGCDGLMVLPPYVYIGDWRETYAHMSAILHATPLSCMIYNNPIAYGTDLTAANMEEFAEQHPNFHAIKDSSGDVRRLTGYRERLGDRVQLFAGLDDMVLEATLMGADGWIAGLVNALPEESVRVFELARNGQVDEAKQLYEWFLPLLRYDTVPKFVQLIKLVQAQVGMGTETVRPPRLPLTGVERQEAQELVRERLAALAEISV